MNDGAPGSLAEELIPKQAKSKVAADKEGEQVS